MPTTRTPRSGSLQFWPRKRAKKPYARIRSWKSWNKIKDAKPLAFLGYKVGMTHFIGVEESKNSHLKGEEVFVPATIVECPPMRIYSVRFYHYQEGVLRVAKEIFFKSEKNLSRKINPAKESSKDLEKINPADYHEITITMYSQPDKAGFGKKKPEIFEVGMSGKKEDQIAFLKENHGKEIDISSIFEENELVDIHAVSKGKGLQGPIRRFGIGLKAHKSEKGVRRVGTLGPWVRQQHISWRVAHAGQMGYHQRLEFNKQILKISNEADKIKNVHKYGNVKSTHIIIYGSIIGVKKRPLIMTKPIRAGQKHQLTLNI